MLRHVTSVVLVALILSLFPSSASLSARQPLRADATAGATSPAEMPPAAVQAGLTTPDRASIWRQVTEYEIGHSQPALSDVAALDLKASKELIASDGGTGDRFGESVAVWERWVVVGAGYHDVGGNVYQGSAYVFHRNQGGIDAWGEAKKLTASDGEAHDCFGESVAVSGDLVLVGAAYTRT